MWGEMARPVLIWKVRAEWSGVLGVSGFGQFWVREIGVKKLLV